MTTCCVTFDKNFSNNEGKFPAVKINFDSENIEHIFEAEDDYPRWFGLHNGVEIWDSELSKLRTWQLTSDYYQPYVAFYNGKMLVWNTTLPGLLRNVKPDYELPYDNMNNFELTIK